MDSVTNAKKDIFFLSTHLSPSSAKCEVEIRKQAPKSALRNHKLKSLFRFLKAFYVWYNSFIAVTVGHGSTIQLRNLTKFEDLEILE